MRGRLLFALVGTLASCSTLAPIPSPQECTNDDDCNLDAGEVCAPDTNICLPGRELPPIRHLGFDIEESAAAAAVFRAEVAGCDKEVFPDTTTKEVLVKRKWYQQTLELGVFATDLEPGAEPTPADVVPSTLSFEQPSRFAYRKLPPRSVQYPTFADEVTMLLAPTLVRLPRYHPDDEPSQQMGDDQFVIWRVVPNEGEVARAPLFRMLQVPLYRMLQDPLTQQDRPCSEHADCCIDAECDLDPNTCDSESGLCTASGNPRFLYNFQYEDDCSRTLRGDVRVVAEGGGFGPLPGATVTIRHADDPDPLVDRLGVFAHDNRPLAEREFQCNSDSSCAPDQFCDQDQCRLALAGRAASQGTTNDTGVFDATVYTYADEIDSPASCAELVTRSFTATVASADGARPTVQYAFSQDFRPIEGLDKPVANLPLDLCLPDWGPPITAELALEGEAVALVGEDDEAYRCCDIGCLPATAADVGMTPAAAACSGATAGGAFPRATLEASAMLDLSIEEWTALGCMPPVVEDGRIGSLVRQADCSGLDGASCTLMNLGAGPDGTAREYELRIESPVGSVLASTRMPIFLDAASQPDAFRQPVVLQPRVLVRGTVRVDEALCDPTTAAETDCGSERAIVLAERLRMADEDPADVVGPFFHQVPTFYDPIAQRPGAYVLPLDPGGVYLITALPAAGSQGGPADLHPIDLREDFTDRTLDLRLPTGVLVTLDVETFDTRAASFTPLDRGSWAGQIPHPGLGEFVDLNRIGECLTPPDEGPLACKIRRLIPGASLTASQVGQLRFTARAASEAAASCPDGP
jgi:hypothetical protein